VQVMRVLDRIASQSLILALYLQRAVSSLQYFSQCFFWHFAMQLSMEHASLAEATDTKGAPVTVSAATIAKTRSMEIPPTIKKQLFDDAA
jgi:hypothetical protein